MLTPTQQTIEYYKQGMSRGEIAEKMGIPVGTVGNRIHRAREKGDLPPAKVVIYDSEKIVQMYEGGMRMVEIAKKEGVSRQLVSTVIYRARIKGRLPTLLRGGNSISMVRRRLEKKRSVVGGIYGMLKKLSPEELRWFEDQIPAGGSAEDFIAALIRDAYYEEVVDN